MVAPVDVYVYFNSSELLSKHRAVLERRSSAGGGAVSIALEHGEMAAVVEAARAQIGSAPLGIVASTEAQALEAIRAGADQAQVLHSDSEQDITLFLDHTRVRASTRREGERFVNDLAQAEKLTALGTLVAGVGHELNNPLSTITLGFDVLRLNLLPDLNRTLKTHERLNTGEGLSSEEISELLSSLSGSIAEMDELLDDLATSTASVSQLVRDLRVFSRNNVAETPTLFQPEQVIEQAIRLVRREFGPNTVLEQDYEDSLPPLLLERNRLAQVVTNLLVNAAHAMNEVARKGHRVRIRARVDEQHLAISIEDTGPGIPEHALERIFDPFFTTKREGQGTGLGLSISRSIIMQMGGDMAVSSTYGEGATFLLFLPLPSPDEIQSATTKRSLLPPLGESANRPSVMIVDDDEGVIRATSRSLREEFTVIVARDGVEATELLSSGSRADAIVLELDLPEMDGRELYGWIRERFPELARKVIVATAAQERKKFREFLSEHKLPVLHKPLSREGLLTTLRTVIQRGRVEPSEPPRSR
jgi:signal transduction histidine kinase